MRLILSLILIVALIAGLLYYADHRNQMEQDASNVSKRPARAGATAMRAGKYTESTINDNPVLGKNIVRGVARDSAGRPVANAQVVCERRTLDSDNPFAPAPGGSRWRTTTGGDGGFSFSTLPEGGFAVLVLTEESVGAGTAATGGGAIGEMIITMYPPGTVDGVVHDALGRAVSGLAVTALYPPGDPRYAFRYFFERTNSQGEFEYTYLPAGTVTLLVQGRNSAPALLADAPMNGERLEIALDEGMQLSGEVRDVNTDALISGAKVTLEDTRQQTGTRTATTDGNGEFTFPNLYPARYRFGIEPGRYALAGRAPEAHPETQKTQGPVVLHAIQTGALRGRVVDASGEKGVENVIVAAESDAASQRVASRASGYYVIPSLPPGDYAVYVAGTELPGDRVPVKSGAQSQGPTLLAPAKAGVHGRVLDELDHPAAFANVYLSLDGSDTPHYTTHTDASGEFLFPAVEQSARIRAWAGLMGRTSIAFGPVTVGPAGIQDLNFVLNMTATAAIHGKVQDSSGVGLPGVAVQCLASDTSLVRPYRTVSAPDGSFAFTNLRPGNYRLGAGQGDIAGDTSYRADLADGEQLEGVILVPKN